MQSKQAIRHMAEHTTHHTLTHTYSAQESTLLRLATLLDDDGGARVVTVAKCAPLGTADETFRDVIS